LSGAFGNQLPVICSSCGNCGKAIYATVSPIYVWVRGFKEGVAKNKIILSNIGNIKGMKSLLSVIVDC